MNRTTTISIIKDYQELITKQVINHRSLKVPGNLKNKACTIIGPRRSGKTFYLFQLAQEKIKKSGIKSILYINFEDDRLFPLKVSDLDTILTIYFELYPEQKDRKPFFLFDEIQNVEGWERFVRRILDTENVELYITGSSSKLLSKEIATALRGRTLTYELFPYTSIEYLTDNKFPVETLPNCTSKQIAALKNLLSKYLYYGGFPELLSHGTPVKEKILKDYLEIMLYRDVIERNNLRNIKSVKLFMKLMITSCSKEFSVNNVYNFFKSQQIKISKNSLYDYLEYFYDALVVFPLRKYSKSLKQQEQTLPKLYLSDSGYLAPYRAGNSEYFGRLMECAVFMKYRREGYEENRDLFYYVSRNGYETDFVLFNKNKPVSLVQCCYDLSKATTKTRELRALHEASEELQCKKQLIVTWDYEETEDGVQYIPFWKFVTS